MHAPLPRGEGAPDSLPSLPLLWSDGPLPIWMSLSPGKRAGSPVTRGILASHALDPSVSRPLLRATLLRQHQAFPITILLDSGADESFIDREVVHQLGIDTVPLDSPIETQALDGRSLARVERRTVPVNLLISGNHHESISLLVISSPLSLVVLGYHWLKTHNPQIDWVTGRVISWSTHCLSHCSHIKLALEEWQHWLEGAEHPFIVWTDHRNLAYIQSAKRLSSRQARWALFFGRFNFSLTYRPGSQNVKPDALSRLYSPENPGTGPETILPPTCLIATLTWEVESAVRLAQRQQPDPGTGPPNRLFVPDTVRSRVLVWAHSSRLTCHPGITCTLDFIRRRFWWSTMDADVCSFIAACATCARNKTSTRPRSGLLRPLPIPSRPWSHIALDFVTGLPPSEGNTTILTVIDCFSKAAHFIALPKLTSSRGARRPLGSARVPPAWHPN